MNKIDAVLENDQYISKKYIKSCNVSKDKYADLIAKHNQDFIKKKLILEKEYFDHLFDKIDSNIVLDLEQRIAILTDEDYNLIVAGAGSGKTTTMAAKIKFLIEKQGILPSEILAVSFAKKNVLELNEKINQIFQLNVSIYTFHKLGKIIIDMFSSKKKGIISDNIKYLIIRDYITKELYKDKNKLINFVEFLSNYFYASPAIAEFENWEEYYKYKRDTTFHSLKGIVGEYNKKIIKNYSKLKRSIKNEYLRSYEELKIANFLYLNGLEYEYEKKYGFSSKEHVYHPDFTIKQGDNIVYLEHFGIHQNGTSTLYSDKDLDQYKHEINIKRKIHAQYGTTMICTFSTYNDGKNYLEHLKEELIRCGFVLNKRDEIEIFDKLMEASSYSELYSFIQLALEFLSKYKLSGKKINEILSYAYRTENERTKFFLINFIPVYLYYEKYLSEHQQIDFEDMILMAIDFLDNNESEIKKMFHYKYIIVDEYQDISDERFLLLKKLSDVLDAKIVAVGDDWQAIFSFAGSNVELFTKFKESMGYGEILKISQTYRNAQELIDIAGGFVQADQSHIKKHLYSSKHISKPIVVYSYDDLKESQWQSKSIIISKIIEQIYTNEPDKSILLIGRYNFDMTRLLNTSFFKQGRGDKIISQLSPKANISFSTVHRSKGLEYDYVIIINAIDSTFGFPSKVKDDAIFDFFGKNKNISYAEERRLFYVALTRTKNKVFIIVPKSKPSPFVIELKENNEVEFTDDTIEQYQQSLKGLKCPHCEYYLKRYYYDEMNGWVFRCTNEKEICNFMTTELQYKIPIKKCPSCNNGYLIYKGISENGYLMIGCTNYNVEDNKCCEKLKFIKPSKIKDYK